VKAVWRRLKREALGGLESYSDFHGEGLKGMIRLVIIGSIFVWVGILFKLIKNERLKFTS
jgi:hypothetical protein